MSLLCADYKLFAKVLASRLKTVVGQLVQPEQSDCIPGRCIYDNISTVRDIISLVETDNTDSGLLFVDQEKAFDSEPRAPGETARLIRVRPEFHITCTTPAHGHIQLYKKINQRLGSPFPVMRGSGKDALSQGSSTPCPLSRSYAN